jgi:toxin ParE1/3/4
MKVYWTHNAVDQLVNIYQYIALNSPTYAKRMVDRITRRSSQIAGNPFSGRMVPEYRADDIRELIEKPYRFLLTKTYRSFIPRSILSPTRTVKLQGLNWPRSCVMQV